MPVKRNVEWAWISVKGQSILKALKEKIREKKKRQTNKTDKLFNVAKVHTVICSVSSLPPEGRTRMAGYLYGAHQEKTFNEQSTGEKEDLGSADCWASYDSV